MTMIAVVLQVAIVNGKPDLGLTPQQLAQIDVVNEGGITHVSFRDDRAAVLKRLGTPAGQDPVWCGMMDVRMAQFLAGLGSAKLERLRVVWATRPTVKAWLLANGVSQDGVNPIVPHVIAGETGGRVDADLADPLA